MRRRRRRVLSQARTLYLPQRSATQRDGPTAIGIDASAWPGPAAATTVRRAASRRVTSSIRVGTASTVENEKNFIWHIFRHLVMCDSIK